MFYTANDCSRGLDLHISFPWLVMICSLLETVRVNEGLGKIIASVNNLIIIMTMVVNTLEWLP